MSKETEQGFSMSPYSITDTLWITQWMSGQKINKLNLQNKERKLIKSFIKEKVKSATEYPISECLKHRKEWKGLLHHLHFKPETMQEQRFVNAIFEPNMRKRILCEMRSV